MEKPKVLFIDSVLHLSDSTGITLSNLFANWPKERLFMIGETSMVRVSKDAGYINHYILTENEYRHRFPIGPIKSIRKRIFNKKSNNNPTNEAQIVGPPNLKLGLANRLFNFFGFQYYFVQCKLSNQLKNWITEADPDYIYALLSTRHSINFAIDVSKRINKPLIIHILDDWPSTIGNNSFFSKYWNAKIHAELKKLLGLSYRRIAISEKMANEYALKYNNDWSYFHNPIDLSLWKPFQKLYIENKMSRVKIAYFGRFGRSNDEAIKDFTAGVRYFNTQGYANYTIEFHLYTNVDSHIKQKIGDNDPNVILHSFISNDKVPIEFSKYDFLLLPISFNDKDVKFARLSMPTKFSEYLISGVPVILMAPKNIAVTEYSEKFNCAFVLDSTSAIEISKKLIGLFQDSALQQQISSRAKFIAENKFSTVVIHESFQQLFN